MKIKTSFLLVAAVTVFLYPATAAHAQTTYFVVGEKPGQEILYDSYLLPLEDPDDIAHARDLIEYGPDIGGALVIAEIMPWPDGINRNWTAPGQPLWSWHVSQFQEFGDFTVELLDGSPTYVENNLDWWMDNTGGQIGFWNYTVIEELTVVPEPISCILFVAGSILLAGRCLIKSGRQVKAGLRPSRMLRYLRGASGTV